MIFSVSLSAAAALGGLSLFVHCDLNCTRIDSTQEYSSYQVLSNVLLGSLQHRLRATLFFLFLRVNGVNTISSQFAVFRLSADQIIFRSSMLIRTARCRTINQTFSIPGLRHNNIIPILVFGNTWYLVPVYNTRYLVVAMDARCAMCTSRRCNARAPAGLLV